MSLTTDASSQLVEVKCQKRRTKTIKHTWNQNSHYSLTEGDRNEDNIKPKQSLSREEERSYNKISNQQCVEIGGGNINDISVTSMKIAI